MSALRNPIVQATIIAALAGAVGLAHGIVSGFEMPRQGGQSLSGLTPPGPREDTAPAGEAEELPTELQLVHSLWESGTATFVDARTIGEFRDGHIPGAFSVPHQAILSGIPEVIDFLDPTLLTIVYCGGDDCTTSKYVAGFLEDLGFADVRIFELGYPFWLDAGFPIETGDPLI